MNFAIPDEQEQQDDIFGIGEFSEVFISEEELEQARKKLEEEAESNSLSNQVKRLSKYHHVDGVSDGYPVKFLYNYFAVGTGKAQFKDGSMMFEGLLLDEPYSLMFDDLSDVRRKQLSDSDMLLFTVDSLLFLQFIMEPSYCLALYGMIQSHTSMDDGHKLHVDQQIDVGHKFHVDQQIDADHKLNIDQSEQEVDHMMDTEVKRLLMEAQIRFNEQVQQAEAEYEATKAQILQKYLCQLCYSSQVSVVLICQHRVCSDCQTQLVANEIKNCPWCRTLMENPENQ